MKGLNLSIYKNPLYEGCSNNGISSRFDEVILVAVKELDGAIKNIEGYIDIKDGEIPTDAVCIIKRKIAGKIVMHLEPFKTIYDGTWYMSGGSFCSSSGARFRDAMGDDAIYGALSLHDRAEGKREGNNDE